LLVSASFVYWELKWTATLTFVYAVIATIQRVKRISRLVWHRCKTTTPVVYNYLHIPIITYSGLHAFNSRKHVMRLWCRFVNPFCVRFPRNDSYTLFARLHIIRIDARNYNYPRRNPTFKRYIRDI